MALTVTTATGSNAVLFPNSSVLSNITTPYCSYYTSGNSGSNDTADAFLRKINFPAVRANVDAGIANAQLLVAKGFTATPTTVNYMSNLQTQVQQLAYVSNCIADQADSTDALFAAKKELALSKERYDMLHSPETHVSYYEGTFPIYRPIGQSTLFILFGMGLFLMLLSLVLFFRTQGIELHLVVPQSLALPGIWPTFAGQWRYMGIAACVGVLLGYVLHIYYK